MKGEAPKKFPHPIASNCLPHIDSFLDNGYTKEEMKMVNETRKILHNDAMRVTATTVRVPVFDSHSESINVEFEKPFDLDELIEVLKNAPGVVVQNDSAHNEYPMAVTAAGKDEVFIGRIRRDESVENGVKSLGSALTIFVMVRNKCSTDCGRNHKGNERISHSYYIREFNFRKEVIHMSIFTGAGVALVTPMHADGSVNFDKMKELIEFQIANDTDALIICGTTGEASTMSDEVQIECIRFAKEAAAGRVPVIAGAGSNDTAHCIALAQGCEKAGADAVLLVTPYYNKATQKGLILHYTAVANSINIPIILYNVPGRTGCNIAPKTVAELAKVKNIVAVKEASGNLSQVAEIAALVGPDFDIYSGNDDQILPVLSLGGKGVISVLSNVAPKQTHDMVMHYLNGDTKAATKLQLDAIELISALFCEVNPIPVKTALNEMGYAVGPCVAPLCEMEPKNLETLRTALKNYGLL